MSHYEAMRRAEETIAAADRGDFDAQFGIKPEERELLTRAEGEGPLSVSDIRALTALNRQDLISAAHDADRINLEGI